MQFLEIGTSRNSVVTKSLDCRGSLSPVLKKNLQLAGPQLGRRREENIGSMRLPEIESPVQNISAHSSLETRVPRIAIVGAGFVGSTTAFALMMSGMAAEIVLIDRDSRRAEGHVNDLRDAEVFSYTTRIFVGDFSDCCSADVTIVTAGVSQSGQ